MKNLIIESGMTLRQFSEFYEIPYGTVRQWYTGERKPPSYIVNLIKKAAKGTQLKLNDRTEYFCYSIEKDGKKGVYRASNIESMKNWAKNVQEKGKKYWIEEHYVTDIKFY